MKKNQNNKANGDVKEKMSLKKKLAVAGGIAGALGVVGGGVWLMTRKNPIAKKAGEKIVEHAPEVVANVVEF